MRFKRNDTYYTIAIYVIGTMVTILLIGVGLFHFKTLWGFLAKTLSVGIQLLKPLIYGLIIAYLFDPLVEMYDKRCIRIRDKKPSKRKYTVEKRTFSTVLAFITFIACIGLVILITTMNIKEVMGSFSDQGIKENITHYIDLFRQMSEQITKLAVETPFESEYKKLLTDFYVKINIFVIDLVEKLIGTTTTFSKNIIPLILGIVIAFYSLIDKKKLKKIMINILNKLFSKPTSTQIIAIGRDIDYVFSGYIRGQLLDAMIMGGLISVALMLIGIDFAIIIGIVSGIFNLIPYFGPIVGFVLAGVIGLMGGEPIKALYAVVAVIVLQQLDGWFIVPKIMGETVKLHPIVVLLSIVIGGQLFGFVGFLLGVPVAGFIRLLLIRLMGDLFEVD